MGRSPPKENSYVHTTSSVRPSSYHPKLRREQVQHKYATFSCYCLGTVFRHSIPKRVVYPQAERPSGSRTKAVPDASSEGVAPEPLSPRLPPAYLSHSATH